MTDKESELIERLMQGDMEAFDELMPNARPEDRDAFEKAIKRMPQDRSGASQLWLAWVLNLMSKTLNHNGND